MPFITIPDMHNNVFVITTERKLSEIGIKSQIKKTLPKNSVCVSCIATAGLVSLTYEKSQTNQQIKGSSGWPPALPAPRLPSLGSPPRAVGTGRWGSSTPARSPTTDRKSVV